MHETTHPQSWVLEALRRHARSRPQAVALYGERGGTSYAELAADVERLAGDLVHRSLGACALWLDNGPAWATIDLAAQAASVALVPVPPFFSDAQLAHAVIDSMAATVFTDQPARFDALARLHGLALIRRRAHELAGTTIVEFTLAIATTGALRRNFAKITYTSGTTGTPKGVCLSQAAMDRVALSLLERIGAPAAQRHVSLLPLATLLENIGGLYLPLLAGGCSYLFPLARVGTKGAAGLNAVAMIDALRASQATSAILIPQMLQSLVESVVVLPQLRFLAVGGAPVSPQLIRRAAERGLPVYEGYGLSECASVVSVNTPAEHRPGSVGKLLPHVELRFAADGEILVRGSVFNGYLGDDADATVDGFWPTGDVGHLDADGFLHLTARKKNMFITSFGRNVAPEWVERELVMQPPIHQAVVFGEGRPWNAAVIVADACEAPARMADAVAAANRHLPDYARVTSWIVTDTPFSPVNAQLTATGRPRREAIWRIYGARLDALYETVLKQEMHG